MMVLFHVPMRWYDWGWLEEGGIEVNALQIFGFSSVVFFGAFAGFFLMVSSTSNMISMYKNLKKGRSPFTVARLQVMGGAVLLLAAILVESIIGYHGYLGEVVLGNPERWDMILWRGFHMETIHTIAFCIMINGVVQGLLSLRGGAKKPFRNMRIYAFLALLCLFLTVPVYEGLRALQPGYPSSEWHSSLAGRDIEVQYAVIGESSLPEILLKALMMPLGGNPEPIFPFLAVSFIGSIIGIYLCIGRADPDFIKKGIIVSLGALITGTLGLVLTIAGGHASIDLLLDNFYQVPNLYPSLWLWWFLMLTGTQLVFLLLIIRLVEFRGIGSRFAECTTSLRRFGFVAFTVYTFQFIDVIPRLLLQLVPCVGDMYPYPAKLSFFLILVMMPLTMLWWELVLRIWERFGYVGGMEWIIGKIAQTLIPDKKGPLTVKAPWWRVKRLDPGEYFYGPEWVDLEKAGASSDEDSRLALKLSIAGLVFFPLSLISFFISISSRKSEGRNRHNTAALVLSVAGMLLFSLLMVILFLIDGIGL